MIVLGHRVVRYRRAKKDDMRKCLQEFPVKAALRRDNEMIAH